jgi:hypothetical protein
MIRHGRLNEFAEWASNFSEDIFVTLKVYADETGTHDGADVIGLSGLMDSKGHWDKFNGKWNKVLKKYGPPYFHYREFRLNANTQPGDTYYGWTLEKRNEYLFELAMIVGETAVPVGGAWPTDHNKKQGIEGNPFDKTIRAFYKSTIDMINKHWPEYNDRVLFIFDGGSQKKWRDALNDVHAEAKKWDSRVGGILLADDKDPSHIALQGADLSAIRMRNHVRGYLETNGQIFDIDIIDFVVSKNVDPQFRNLPKATYEKLIRDMRYDEALQRRHGFIGQYVPLKHFDFKKYGYKYNYPNYEK